MGGLNLHVRMVNKNMNQLIIFDLLSFGLGKPQT